ncbi:MAG: glycosyltransferase [Candidatus Paceibacterota bacterium]|jgi:glycosyltransferase involved in cell wall biosynthesis
MNPVESTIKAPLASIILPVYNGADRIKEAIKSVSNQSYTDWELLVVDDGSTDNTEEIINNFLKNDSRIRYIKNKVNLGIQKSLNKGLREAKGKYIARIDDDDIWIDKDKLKKQLEFLESNKEYVLIGTGVVVVDKNKKELFRYLMLQEDQKIRNKILRKNCFAHSSVVFRKDTALKLGGYSEEDDVRHIEDYDLWLKLGIFGKFANIGEYSIAFMERSGSITSDNKIIQAKRTIFEIFKFKYQYPNFIIGYLLSIMRLLFFFIQKVVPFNEKFIYKIKKIYKQQ